RWHGVGGLRATSGKSGSLSDHARESIVLISPAELRLANKLLTREVPVSRAGLGLRGRLLLAFVGISMFTVVAGLSGHYTFNEVIKALNRTGATIPPALAAVELTRLTEQVLSSGPRILDATSEDEVRRHSDIA